MKLLKPFYCLTLLLLCSSQVSAQNFDGLVDALNNELEKVISGKYEYNQKATMTQPGVIQLSIVETTIKDGKSKESSYEFNLADIDENTVKTITNKDLIQVQLLSTKKQDLLKCTEDREKISYKNELFVYAANIDNARALEDRFKALIPVAQEITEKRLSLTTYEDHMQWIVTNVSDVNLIKTQFAQKVSLIETYPGKMAIAITENSGKTSKSDTYEFNVMTINPNSILFKISGEEFSIALETRRKLKTIKHFKEGVQENYISDFEIACESVETARDLQKVLKSLIQLSQEAFDRTVKKPETISEAIETLNVHTKKVTVNETTINQLLKGDCVVAFTQNNVSAKGISGQEYVFNFKDLNKNAVQYETKGKFVLVNIATNGGSNFIKHTEDNEQKNYTDSFTIYVPEIEDAITVQKAMETIIELCNSEKDTYTEGDKANLVTRLQEQIKKVDLNDKSYEQVFTAEDDHNSIVFKQIEVTSKSSEERTYDFNLSDINPASIKMETSGKNVTIVANTYYLEKIIQYYEDGEIENYQNEIEIQAGTIENARTITTLFKKVSGKE